MHDSIEKIKKPWHRGILNRRETLDMLRENDYPLEKIEELFSNEPIPLQLEKEKKEMDEHDTSTWAEGEWDGPGGIRILAYYRSIETYFGPEVLVKVWVNGSTRISQESMSISEQVRELMS